MVKQKIQDNLLVLERDCVEVLEKTETLLQGNKVTKAKLGKVTAGLLTEYVVFVLGVALLCLSRSWAGVRRSYDVGVRIASNSWGDTSRFYYDSMCEQADSYMWKHNDFLLLFAVKNSHCARTHKKSLCKIGKGFV